MSTRSDGAYIYALVDSGTEEVRYIGKTIKPLRTRVSRHMCSMRAGSQLHVHRWMRRLGQRPTCFVLDQCDSQSQLDEAERFWIDWYRRSGSRLCNLTQGGDGGATSTGFKLSPERIERLREVNRGLKHGPPSAETRAKQSASQRGIPKSAATRAKYRAYVKTPAHRAAISAAMKRAHGRKQASQRALW